MRTPLYLLTDGDYRVVGAVTREHAQGDYIGHDTQGRQIFRRKDRAGMRQAAKRLPYRLVSSAWYGI